MPAGQNLAQNEFGSQKGRKAKTYWCMVLCSYIDRKFDASNCDLHKLLVAFSKVLVDSLIHL